jgi:hypothetical protein
MSFEYLEEARAQRVEKESTQEAKCKRNRGRKPKSSPPKAEEGTTETARRGRKRKSSTPEVDEGNCRHGETKWEMQELCARSA